MAAPTFDTILDLDDGFRWVALDTSDQAMLAQRLSETAVGHFQNYDSKQGRLSPVRRYYALTEAEGDPRTMPVVLVADKRELPAGERRSYEDGSLVVGRRNTDPYPEHGDAIAALSDAIGIPLPPGTYPYRRRDEDERSGPTP